MQELTFSLTGIDFEGPLSLILQLLARDKIEIRDIRIADIVDQYLKQLDLMESMNLEIAGEFIVMAAQLTYMKARAMMDEEKNVSEIEQLISALETLKKREGYGFYKAFAEYLGNVISFDTYAKPPEEFAPDKTYRYSIKPLDLLRALNRIVPASLLNASEKRIKQAMPQPVSFEVAQKEREILTIISEFTSVKLSEVYDSCKSVSELVASFLAILQLIREEKVSFRDDELTVNS
jgi:segregation and condensation protein A